MSQLTDSQIEKILEVLKNSSVSAYEIAKNTKISQATIGNYRKGKTIPTQPNALILKQYFGIDFADDSENFSQNRNSIIIGSNNKTGNIDNRQYFSDSPDVLRSQIETLDERIREKDAQIREKDAQIREKDAQIAKLLSIISDLGKK